LREKKTSRALSDEKAAKIGDTTKNAGKNKDKK